jgi:glycerol-3-phosphate acyltransferase PlsY
VTTAHLILLLAIPLGFIMGSIPFGLLIAKRHGIDIRQHGSGNIGATNVKRVLGTGPGRVCFILDVLKGLVPTAAAGLLAGVVGFTMPDALAGWLWVVAMISPVLGHVFCPWIGFKGGKGVATALGSLVAVAPIFAIAGLLALGVWWITLRVTRYVSIASIAAGLSLPVWSAACVLVLMERATPATSAPFLVIPTLLAALVVWTHRGNLSRIRAGTEPKAHSPTASASDDPR